MICARRAAPSPRRHGGTEGHGEGKPGGGPISASDRVLTPSNATSRRALLLSAGAPQVPRTRGRAPGWNRSSRVPLHTSQHDYAGVRTRGVEARRGPPLPSPWSQCPPKPPCQSSFLPVASATHASRHECLLHAAPAVPRTGGNGDLMDPTTQPQPEDVARSTGPYRPQEPALWSLSVGHVPLEPATARPPEPHRPGPLRLGASVPSGASSIESGLTGSGREGLDFHAARCNPSRPDPRGLPDPDHQPHRSRRRGGHVCGLGDSRRHSAQRHREVPTRSGSYKRLVHPK